MFIFDTRLRIKTEHLFFIVFILSLHTVPRDEPNHMYTIYFFAYTPDYVYHHSVREYWPHLIVRQR